MTQLSWSFPRASLALALPLLLAGCGGTTPGAGGSVSGTVYLPGAGAGTQQVAAEDVPGEYIVKIKPGVSAQGLGRLSVNGQRLRQVSQIPALRLALYRTEAAPQGGLQAQLAALPGVESVSPNTHMQAFKTPNDPLYKYKWDARALNLPSAWDVTTGGGVVVAVVDSGVTAHPDLAGKLLPGYDFVSDPQRSGDGGAEDADPTDPGGDSEYHGTHVAGIIAAATNNGVGTSGVSWGAKILPVRALGTDGGGSSWDILRAMSWAGGLHVDGAPDNPNPAKVINLSLGGKASCDAGTQNAINTLTGKGVTIVVAAGNENQNAGNVTPGNCTGVITVGAVGPDGGRAPYSNYGARIDVMAPGGNSAQLLSYSGDSVPGSIVSTLKIVDSSGSRYGYGLMEGTSMAAPEVSGVVALMLSQDAGLSPADVRARLKASARALSGAQCGVSGGCGAGLVNAAGALGSTATGSEPAPVTVGTAKTWAIALYQQGADFDTARSKAVPLAQTSLRLPYQIAGLQPGTYTLVAWQDLNANDEVDDSEPVGVYPNDVSVSRPGLALSGVNIQMTPYHQASLTDSARQLALRRAMGKVRADAGHK